MVKAQPQKVAPSKKPTTKAPAAPPKGKEVALKKPGAVAKSATALFAAHRGAGLENVTAKDILVPRIGILQGLSPQVTKGKPNYDETAKVGDIYDIGLSERLGEEIMVVPIYYAKVYLEWFPRNTGKGLARIHDDPAILEQCKPDEKNRPTLPNGNYVAETAQFYVLNLSNDERLSFIPMTSTQLKKGRQWLTWATGEKVDDGEGGTFTPPLFYRAYKLTTVPESNSEGNWVGWKIERGPKLEDMEGFEKLFDKLVEINQQIGGGTMKADMRDVDTDPIVAGGAAGNDEDM